MAGYQLVCAKFHPKYGTVTYVQHGIRDIAVLSLQRNGDIFQLAVKVNVVTFAEA